MALIGKEISLNSLQVKSRRPYPSLWSPCRDPQKATFWAWSLLHASHKDKGYPCLAFPCIACLRPVDLSAWFGLSADGSWGHWCGQRPGLRMGIGGFSFSPLVRRKGEGGRARHLLPFPEGHDPLAVAAWSLPHYSTFFNPKAPSSASFDLHLSPSIP